MRIELACGAQFGGGVCAWHRGGGDAAYARSEARTNEGHGTSTLKATGHAYMLSPSCLRVWVYYSRGARLVLHQVALVKLEEQQQGIRGNNGTVLYGTTSV